MSQTATRDWHLLRNGTVYGPFSDAQLVVMLDKAQIVDGDLIALSGSQQWMHAKAAIANPSIVRVGNSLHPRNATDTFVQNLVWGSLALLVLIVGGVSYYLNANRDSSLIRLATWRSTPSQSSPSPTPPNRIPVANSTESARPKASEEPSPYLECIGGRNLAMTDRAYIDAFFKINATYLSFRQLTPEDRFGVINHMNHQGRLALRRGGKFKPLRCSATWTNGVSDQRILAVMRANPRFAAELISDDELVRHINQNVYSLGDMSADFAR